MYAHSCTYVERHVFFIHMIFGDITLQVRTYGYTINNKSSIVQNFRGSLWKITAFLHQLYI